MFNVFSQSPLIQQPIELPIDSGSDTLGNNIFNINYYRISIIVTIWKSIIKG